MKDSTPELNALLASKQAILAFVCTITLANGDVLRLTTAPDFNVVWAGQVYNRDYDGARFVVCDDRLYKQKISPEDVGKTLHFKLQSFNVYNDGLEDLSSVTAYSIVITEPLSAGTTFDQWA